MNFPLTCSGGVMTKEHIWKAMNTKRMTPNFIEDLITRVAASTAPGAGDNLLGFEMDATVDFGKSRVVDSSWVQRTEDPRELIRVHMRLGHRLSTVEEAVNAVLGGFDRVAYTHFRASNLERFREGVRLRFVTVLSAQSYFVSGTVLALGPRYSAIALESDLPALPGGVPEWAL